MPPPLLIILLLWTQTISNDVVHNSLLQTVDEKAADLDLYNVFHIYFDGLSHKDFIYAKVVLLGQSWKAALMDVCLKELQLKGWLLDSSVY